LNGQTAALLKTDFGFVSSMPNRGFGLELQTKEIYAIH